MRLEKLHNEKIQNLHQMKDQETAVEYSTHRRATKCRSGLVEKSDRNRILRKIWAKYGPINSVALVRERTIPTDRPPPPVGEVSANFCG